MLYETMMQHPAKLAQMCQELAAFMQQNPAEGTAQVCQELAAILRRRNELETLPSRPELSPELAEAAALSNASICQELDAVFTQICRTLDAKGLTLSGGEISALKRLETPGTLAAELDALKREAAPILPETERLAADDAAALYAGLTRQGLISGPLAAFSYYLAQQSNGQPKRPESGLSWTGTAAQFAYFAKRYFQHTQGVIYTNREKALCLAFGLDDRQRQNVIRPYLYDLAGKDHKATRGSAVIDAVFNTLPSLNKQTLK